MKSSTLTKIIKKGSKRGRELGDSNANNTNQEYKLF